MSERNRNIDEQARQLADALYADVHTVSEEEWDAVRKEVAGYCQARDYTPEWTESWMRHVPRLHLTMNWLKSFISDGEAYRRGLEMGGISLATDLLVKNFPHTEWQSTHWDLRQQWDVPDSSIDLIVSMEVIEHFADLPDDAGYNDSFLRSGLRSVLKECYRVLRPGGLLYITTPNGASVIHLEKVLNGYSPWFYAPHVREYTLDEIQEEVRAAGFAVRGSKVVHCMTSTLGIDYSGLFRTLLCHDYSTTNRGDDIFLLAVKPKKVVRKED